MILPLHPCVFILLSFDCAVSLSSAGSLYWKAAAFPALTETRLIVASDPPQGLRHLSTVTAGGVCLVAQSYLTLCHPMGCSPPGSSVHGSLQARILGRVATFLLQGIFLTQRLNLHLLCLLHCRWIIYHGATGEGKDSSLICSTQPALPCFPESITGYSVGSPLLRSIRHPAPSLCSTLIDTDNTCSCW